MAVCSVAAPRTHATRAQHHLSSIRSCWRCNSLASSKALTARRTRTASATITNQAFVARGPATLVPLPTRGAKIESGPKMHRKPYSFWQHSAVQPSSTSNTPQRMQTRHLAIAPHEYRDDAERVLLLMLITLEASETWRRARALRACVACWSVESQVESKQESH